MQVGLTMGQWLYALQKSSPFAATLEAKNYQHFKDGRMLNAPHVL
jgi:hypothetical protein